MYQIVNMRHRPEPPYLYVGRTNREHQDCGLGNPYSLKYYERCEAMDRYRAYIWERMKEMDFRVLSMLVEITPETKLACWCCEKEGEATFHDPEICHAQIIWKAWKYLHDSGQFESVKAWVETTKAERLQKQTEATAAAGVHLPVDQGSRESATER